VASAAAAAVAAGTYQGCLMLFPLDPRLPKCIIGPDNLATLPQELKWVYILIIEFAALNLLQIARAIEWSPLSTVV
jgi:hypothetical protein